MAIHAHFVDDTTPLDAANLNTLFRGEGTVNNSSLITTNNNFYRTQDSGAFTRNVLGIDATDNLIVGYSGANLRLQGDGIVEIAPHENNIPQRFKEVGGTIRDVLNLDAADAVVLGNANNVLTVNGVSISALPPLQHLVALSELDSGGTPQTMIRIAADDTVHVGYAGAAVLFDGPLNLTQTFGVPNNVAFTAEDTSSTPQEMIKVDGTDIIQLGYAAGRMAINPDITTDIVLENTRFTRGVDSGSTEHNLIGITGGDIVQVSYATASTQILGSLSAVLTTANNISIQSEDSGGTPRNFMRMDGADIMHFGEAGFVFQFDGTFSMGPADRLVDNDTYYQGRDTGGTPRDLIGINAVDILALGDAAEGTGRFMSINPLIIGAINLQQTASIVWGGRSYAGDSVAGTTRVFTFGNNAEDSRYQFNNTIAIENGGLFAISAGSVEVPIINHDTTPITSRQYIEIGTNTTQMEDRHLSGGHWFMNPGADSTAPNLQRFNSNMTDGLTIRAGDIGTPPSGEFFNIRDGESSHHILASTDNNTFFRITNVTPTDSGALLHGIGGSNDFGIEIRGTAANASTAPASGTTTAPVIINSSIHTGTVESGSGGSSNIAVIRDGNTTRFIFKANGEAVADIAWNTFDDFEDVELLRSMQILMQPDNLAPDIATAFGAFAETNREILEQQGIVTFNSDRPGGFVSLTRLPMLLSGAVIQNADELAKLRQRVADLETQNGF